MPEVNFDAVCTRLERPPTTAPVSSGHPGSCQAPTRGDRDVRSPVQLPGCNIRVRLESLDPVEGVGDLQQVLGHGGPSCPQWSLTLFASVLGLLSAPAAAYGYVYRSALVAGVGPAGVVTETRTWPATCAGEVAMIEVDDETVNALAVVVPNLTLCTVENPVPAMVTLVPPATGPDVRESEVMVGP